METKDEHINQPMQYDVSRDILNTPPPSLITRTNLLIIAIVVVVLCCVSFIKLPVFYTTQINIVDFPKSANLAPIKMSQSSILLQLVAKDRIHVTKNEALFSIKQEGEIKHIRAPYSGEIIYQRPLKSGMKITSNNVIAWLKSDKIIPCAITLNVQAKDITHFRLNEKVELNDAQGKSCILVVKSFSHDKSNYLVHAQITQGDAEYDFNTAQLNVKLKEKTLLEQFTAKQN